MVLSKKFIGLFTYQNVLQACLLVGQLAHKEAVDQQVL